MKRALIVLTFLFTALLGTGKAQAQGASFGITIANGQVQGFHMAIGDYYRVPANDITYIQRQGICDEEIPVVLYMSQRSGYSPDDIIQMRRQGVSWGEISDRCGIDQAYYNQDGYTQTGYYETGRPSGPPYGKAWGYWKKRPRRIMVSDACVVSTINANFLANRYHRNSAEVLRLRSSGNSFPVICNQFSQSRYRDNDRDYKGHYGYNNRYGDRKYKRYDHD
ncbi:MAG TPA: hypothetical protein VL633_10680 [Bacteroidota bacterium]|jgi:hypothetical protein|nr:hypothetical protein [Bacteroidota bacterium]